MAGGPTHRAIEIEGLRNLRDIGGLPTADGRRIRRGVLFRSEAPVALTQDGAAALGALGLGTTIDLRSEASSEFTTTNVPDSVRRACFVLEPPGDAAGRSLPDMVMSGDLLDYTADELAALYLGFIDERADGFGAIVEHLADPANLPCLVHCHAGKDRTGLVIAIVLGIAGVGRAEIVADYEASTHYRAYRRGEVEDALISHGTSWERVRPLFTAPGEVLEATLDHMGPAWDYLRDRAGVAVPTLTRLRELLLEPGSGAA